MANDISPCYFPSHTYKPLPHPQHTGRGTLTLKLPLDSPGLGGDWIQVCDIIPDKVKTLYEQDLATTDLSSSDSTCTQPQAKKWKEETAMSFLLGVGTESDGDTPSWQDEIE